MLSTIKNICNRFMYKLCIVLLIFLTMTNSSYGADKIQQYLSLSTAIDRALKQNPELRGFRFLERAIEGKSATAKLSPPFKLGSELGYDTNDNQTEHTELVVSLSSVIELGGKSQARTHLVNTERLQMEAKHQIEALDLLGDVTRAFIDVLTAQERLALAVDAESLTQESLDTVKLRAAAGASPEAEVKRALAARAKAQLTVLSEQRQWNYSKAVLAALWGDTAEPIFTHVKGDLYHFGKDIKFSELFSRAQQNPALQFYASAERVQEAELRLAKTQSSLDVQWSVGLKYFKTSHDTALMAGFNIPLFAERRNSGAITTATARRNLASINRETAALKLHTQLYKAYKNRQQAIMTVTTVRNNIMPLLEDTLNETKKAYEQGLYGYLDLVAVQQELIDARRVMIDAAAAALRYGADIEQLTSEPLSIGHDVKSP